MEINAAFLIAQLLNFIFLFLLFGALAVVIYRLVIRRKDETSHIRLRPNDVQTIDIVDDQEAIVRLNDGSKIRIRADDILVNRLSE